MNNPGEVKTLMEIFDFSSGKSIKNNVNGNYPIYGSNGIIGYTNQFNEEEGLLIGRVGASGSIHKLSQKAWVTDNVLIARPKVSMDKEFLYFSLIGMNLLQYATKSAQPLLTQQILNPLKIWFPELKEQKKIASILSKVSELIQKSDQIIEQTRIIKRGLMEQLLTKGIGHTKFKKSNVGEIPAEWVESSIGTKCKLGTGGTPSRSNPEYFKGQIPWVKTTEINFNRINSTEEHITTKALEESSAKVYPKGSLLMAMYGQGITRGRTAILEIDAAINQACAAIQSLGEISILFLYYWCQHNYETIRSISQGTHQSNLNLEYVGKIKIAIPPLKEQKTIEDILSRLDSLLEVKHLQVSSLIKIKKGLMQKLLTGKIRVKT